MSSITKLEKYMFSNLQREFDKLENSLKKKNIFISKKNNLFKELYNLNYEMLCLENRIKSLRIKINNKYDFELDDTENEEIEDHEKDKKIIELFKPLMLYYRMILN